MVEMGFSSRRAISAALREPGLWERRVDGRKSKEPFKATKPKGFRGGHDARKRAGGVYSMSVEVEVVWAELTWSIDLNMGHWHGHGPPTPDAVWLHKARVSKRSQ